MITAYNIQESWIPASSIVTAMPSVESGEWFVFFAVVFRVAIGIGVTVTVVVIFVASYRLITSEGNEAHLEKGKAIIKWGLIGITVMLFGYSGVRIALRTPFTSPRVQELPRPPMQPAVPAPVAS